MKKLIENKVFALITTYNPDIGNLSALILNLDNQVERIVICNNSDFDLDESNLPESKLCQIFNFRNNLGIAEAQSIGMKWAFENFADFVLQMDQDSTPHEDMTEQLLECYKILVDRGSNPGLIGVQDYDKITKQINKARLKKGKPIDGYNSYYEVDCTLSSGSLIPHAAYKTIGGMRNDLFIDAVDHEYCWRLKKAGFKIIRNRKALLGHRLGEGKFKILNLVSVGMPSPFRHYYATRNIFILFREPYVPFYWKLSSLIKLLGKVIFFPVFMPKGKERLNYFMKGIVDGVANRSGRMK